MTRTFVPSTRRAWRRWTGRVGPGVVAHATLNTVLFLTAGASLVGRHLAG